MDKEIEDLKYLRALLKSGEYDGVHIMRAWIAIEELIEFKNTKNWTRSYNYKGELIPEFALYIPKLPKINKRK